MSGGIGHLILSGPLLFAVPVAAAAGAVTFLSPCVLPLVPDPAAHALPPFAAPSHGVPTTLCPQPVGTPAGARASYDPPIRLGISREPLPAT